MAQALEDYEFLASQMKQMHQAAAKGEWDRMVELEKKCSDRVDMMKAQTAPAPLGEQERQRKAALIREILAEDALIRDITQPWMAQVQTTLRNVHRERRVLKAYSSS